MFGRACLNRFLLQQIETIKNFCGVWGAFYKKRPKILALFCKKGPDPKKLLRIILNVLQRRLRQSLKHPSRRAGLYKARGQANLASQHGARNLIRRPPRLQEFGVD